MAQIAVAELKSTLSEQLRRVKAGEELVVTERGVPIARIVPCGSAGETVLDLVAAGLARLPQRPLPPDFFTAFAARPSAGVLRALLDEREEGR